MKLPHKNDIASAKKLPWYKQLLWEFRGADKIGLLALVAIIWLVSCA